MQFYLTSLQGKEYFAKEPEPEPVGAGCFWHLGAAQKKVPGARAGAGAAWEKNQEPEPEPLKKKSGSGAEAAKKFAGSPALVAMMILTK